MVAPTVLHATIYGIDHDPNRNVVAKCTLNTRMLDIVLTPEEWEEKNLETGVNLVITFANKPDVKKRIG